MANWTSDDERNLRVAVQLLEHPSLVARLGDVIGGPIERGISLLPANWREGVAIASKTALFKALAMAVKTLGTKSSKPGESEFWHKVAVTASGATGGLFGLAAIAVELPVSTTLMLRSIAAIARKEGEDLQSLDARLQCLEVFAFGAERGITGGAESGYWTVRVALSRAVTEAGTFLAERGIVEESAPPLVRLITAIAARFGMVVSEEVAAKAIPVIGAVSGATINYLFMDHFQKMAKGHFIVRRLERTHGQGVVREQYDAIVKQSGGW
ncbi:MAG: EcsC family protein [Bacteroidota bacterium]